MPQPVVETRSLTKTYDTGAVAVHALRGVDVSIDAGEMTAIVGPSGSGKSSLLSLVGAIDKPTSGAVLIEGVDLASLSDDDRTILRRRRIGFVFQAFNLMPTLSAVENIALPLELDGVSADEARQRAMTALESVGLVPRADHLPSMLSGGEQQRVAVARALVIQPALVLADEPTGNLDTTSGAAVMTLLRDLVAKRKQTVVIVTHDMEIAAHADRTIKVRDGRIEADVRQTPLAPAAPGNGS